MNTTRNWCGCMQYPDKDVFRIGTVSVEGSAKLHEVELALWKIVDELLPTRPKLIDLIPGSLFFVEETND